MQLFFSQMSKTSVFLWAFIEVVILPTFLVQLPVCALMQREKVQVLHRLTLSQTLFQSATLPAFCWNKLLKLGNGSPSTCLIHLCPCIDVLICTDEPSGDYARGCEVRGIVNASGVFGPPLC